MTIEISSLINISLGSRRLRRLTLIIEKSAKIIAISGSFILSHL